MKYDIFISYASEDKEDIAIPLAIKLKEYGLRVWLDEFELTIGDSIRRSIDLGLSESKFGVVILSHNFFKKEWPQKELDGLFSRDDGQNKLILPIWHNVNYDDVRKFSPILADKIAVNTTKGIDFVASQILKANNRKFNIQNITSNTPINLINDKLTMVRKNLLTAHSYRELKETQYMVEELLSIYPSNPDVKLLRDEIERAIYIETQPPCSPPPPPPPPPSMRLAIFSLIKFILKPIIAGGIIYLLYRFILWLIEIIK